MENPDRGFSRRAVIAGGAALVSLIAGAPWAAAQQPLPPWEQELRKLLGESKPIEGKTLTVDLPEIAENGNTVPFTIGVDSPMTEAAYVKTVHIISTANPQPVIGVFHFTPASGKAVVSGRLRLASSQDVITVAELSDGHMLLNRRPVKVTIGGCGGG